MADTTSPTSRPSSTPSATPETPETGTDRASNSAESEELPSVVKRDGRTVSFEPDRIEEALRGAFRAAKGLGPEDTLTETSRDRCRSLTREVTGWAKGRKKVDVEQIQDEVERALMRAGEHAVARRYILYREERTRERRVKKLRYTRGDGTRVPIDYDALEARIEAACRDLEGADSTAILEDAATSFFDGMPAEELRKALILAARSKVETDPDYRFAAARLLLEKIYGEAAGEQAGSGDPAHRAAGNGGTEPGESAAGETGGEAIRLSEAEALYQRYFPRCIRETVAEGRLDERLLNSDLERLAEAIDADRDLDLTYHSVQTLYDRYLIQRDGRRVELPQILWMRVAMGLALREHESDREERAIEFYDLMSKRRFVPSTPTLFNAGTDHPQLSSCYLTTVQDDLGKIFDSIKDNAMLSKWAGGLGNDWTSVRAMGAHIAGTNGESQGVVPFLKVANDTLVAVNQGGKRKGAGCAYLETWHLDIEDFLELRKNTGDERRRTHDMNTANWIPDLFMKRVIRDEEWTLFSPDDVPDLHELYGRAFEERYREYEQMAEAGEITLTKTVSAVSLWRKMLSMLFETGHPWLTFKDPANIRSPQDHEGVVHSSNLCTEILLNTSEEETAVCNLGSVNLLEHVGEDGTIDHEKLEATITRAIRMLDNVIDLNFYPTEEAERANMRHRPIGLGTMGFQDVLHRRGISYASEEAVELADRTQEAVAYHAIRSSAQLAEERGAYPTFEGSKWDRGLLPQDTIDLLEEERGEEIPVPRGGELDWTPVREAIAAHGMRNSNVMAIAPTATISNITGVTPSIEPTYKQLFVKSNLSGEFTVINPHLVEALKDRDLWDARMVEDLKYYDGSVQPIDRIPDDMKREYRTAFEIGADWLLAAAARRQKWIDMGQSLNLYVAEPSGRKLSATYKDAWRLGLKTTYYLRSTSATQVEKSTIDINQREMQPRWMKSTSPSSAIGVERENGGAPKGPDGDASSGADGRDYTDSGTSEARPDAPETEPTGPPQESAPLRPDRTSDLPSCEIDEEACEVCQ